MALRAFDDANVVEINQNEGRFPIFIGADGLGDLHLGSQLSNVNDAVTVIANMAMGDKRRSEVLDEDELEPSEAVASRGGGGAGGGPGQARFFFCEDCLQ